MLIVSDTTPIIALVKADRLNLLEQLFGTVLLPRAVHNELVGNPAYADEACLILSSTFLQVHDVSDRSSVQAIREIAGLDAGESEAIALATEKQADYLLMDEHKGRQTAKKMRIRITGTIGILLKAYDEGLLSKQDVLDCMEKFRCADIRISKALYDVVTSHL